MAVKNALWYALRPAASYREGAVLEIGIATSY